MSVDAVSTEFMFDLQVPETGFTGSDFSGRGPSMTRQKVFCIGLGKTGTTSLKESLRILGYQTTRLPLDWKGITDFDAALPGVSAAMFEELDVAFPDSKFILTLRDVEGWLKSIEKDMARKVGVRREHSEDREVLLKLLYGTTVFDEDRFRKGFHDHEARARRYFENRPDDLLVLNITRSAGWDPLCSFLGVPVPEEPFPFANKATEQDELLLRLLSVIQDTDEVARISKYSRAYIEQLSRLHDVEHYDLKRIFVLSDDRRINKIIKRSCTYFGGTARAAKALNISEDSLKEAIARQRRHARDKRRTRPIMETMRRLLRARS